jgi:ssRNA-specific RNase YbeY (16S rRNA maturation enzyme)
MMAHRVLHLCGFGDKTPEEKAKMTAKGDAALGMWEEV